ncbi:MAG TPA: GNAT family N-acetyltransferase [Frankiaceae bacterium]|nr:GNAT family N-acetyltransferase [Frankiaceae bacterium]
MRQHADRADVPLPDGRTVHVRPVRGTDAAALRELHEGLSGRSVYLRYLLPRRFSDADLARELAVGDRRTALVAELSGRLVGIGEYVRLPTGGRAELAVTVADAQQGLGIGTALLGRLARHAVEQGVRELVAEVLPDNHPMLSALAATGYRMRRHPADGVVRVVLSLDAVGRAEAARRAGHDLAFRAAVRTGDALGRAGRALGLHRALRRR